MREYEEGDGGRGGEEGRVHTLSERRTVAAGGVEGEGEKLKAGLLVGFNYICLYLHNKQQPVGLLGMPVPLLVFSPRSTRSAR